MEIRIQALSPRLRLNFPSPNPEIGALWSGIPHRVANLVIQGIASTGSNLLPNTPGCKGLCAKSSIVGL